MTELFKFYKKGLAVINENEASFIDKVKITLFYKTLWSFVPIIILTLIIVIAKGYSSYFIFVAAFFTLITILGVYLIFTGKKWRVWIHIILWLILSVLIIEIFYNSSTTDFLLMEYCFIIIIVSFMLLSNKYGFIYSIIATSVIVTFLIKRFFVFQINADIDNSVTLFLCLSILFHLMFLCYTFMDLLKKLILDVEKSRADELKLNDELIKSTKEAENNIKQKSDFLSSMSHELRTPLNAVIGFTQLLLEEDPAEDQIEDLNILLGSSEGLLALINDILDYNKLESGHLQLESFSFKLNSVVQKVFQTQKVNASEKNINYHLICPQELVDYYVVGDQTRLYQILHNLLENAVKFTYEGAVVFEIKILKSSENNIQLSFEVRDTGLGLNEEEILFIFDPYHRTVSHKNFVNLALGVSIVQQLLLAHQSELHCESEINKGTTFHFNLDYKIDSHFQDCIKETNIIENEELFQNLQILLVEDNLMNIVLMSKILNSWLIPFDLAQNGLEAIEKVKEKNYDLIIMDINMPIMNGFEASKIIKELKPTIKIVALSASLKEDIKMELFDAHIDNFLSKPFTKSSLKLMIYHTCF